MMQTSEVLPATTAANLYGEDGSGEDYDAGDMEYFDQIQQKQNFKKKNLEII